MPCNVENTVKVANCMTNGTNVVVFIDRLSFERDEVFLPRAINMER